MTNTQKLDLRRSEVRARLNEIAGLEGDAFTDEIRTEAGTLQAEYSDLEIRHRAAIVAEPPETVTEGAEDGEAVELRAIRPVKSTPTMRLRPSPAGASTGAEAEYNSALKMGAEKFPLRLLAPGGRGPGHHRRRRRGDARRLAGPGILQHGGGRAGREPWPVAPGAASFPVVTAGATPAQRGRTQDRGGRGLDRRGNVDANRPATVRG